MTRRSTTWCVGASEARTEAFTRQSLSDHCTPAAVRWPVRLNGVIIHAQQILHN